MRSPHRADGLVQELQFRVPDKTVSVMSAETKNIKTGTRADRKLCELKSTQTQSRALIVAGLSVVKGLFCRSLEGGCSSLILH